jgi:hypothetical protein
LVIKVSLVYLTNRINPRFEWFAQSLRKQLLNLPDVEIQLIIVDFYSQFDEQKDARFKYFNNRMLVDGYNWLDDFIVVGPKPTVWQGRDRLTGRDYFAAANSRNTGICYAQHPYVVFCDDLSILMPPWLLNVRRAAIEGCLICGAYRKVLELRVRDGFVSGFKDHPNGYDSRWSRGSDVGEVKCQPGELFGCSFGALVEDLLAVNGLEEACDAVGGEDYNLSLRLWKHGKQPFYNRNMLTWESEEAHHEAPPMLRIDPKVDPDKCIRMPNGMVIHNPQTDASHVILTIALDGGPQPVGNLFDLRQLREMALSGRKVPAPTEPSVFWPTGEPLKGM